MEQARRLLEARKAELIKIKNEKEKALVDVPVGALRINCAKGTPQYYYRTDPKDTSGTYIPQKDNALAYKLAQKDYDEKVLRSVNKELQITEKYLVACTGPKAEDIYESLHIERQRLIIPIQETDEQFVKMWEEFQYQGKAIEDTVPPIYTAKGERVRSKSEVIIADNMRAENIPYRYECPLFLKGWGTVYPDFTALNIHERKEIYYEHFGMMDNPEYVEKVVRKISIYEDNGIYIGDRLIVTWETQKNPLDPRKVRALIRKYLK